MGIDALIAMLVPVIVGSFGAWYWFGDDARRTRRVLRKARVTPVAALVDGQLACVVGTVELEGNDLLTSMVAKMPCVAYDTNVYFFAGHNATVPQRVEVERRLLPFFVRDDSGVVRIDAAEAALSNKPVAKSERYEERVISPGTKIRIVGSVHLERAIDTAGARERHYREATGTNATLTGTKKFPLLIDSAK
jgi:hypothetical protein